MVSSKKIAFLLAIGFIVAADAFNFIRGKRQPGDFEACHFTVNKSIKLWTSLQSKPCKLPSNHNITYIYANETKETSAEIFIASGGIGQSNITLRFEEDVKLPLMFSVHIYAKCETCNRTRSIVTPKLNLTQPTYVLEKSKMSPKVFLRFYKS